MATIMVMDDEAPIRTLIRTALESVGHEVMEAANGHDGLALYRQRPADLVIADILMPELDGLDTIIELMQEFYQITSPLYADMLQLVKWEAGMFMRPHADNANPDGSTHQMAHRDFAGVVYLNDDYEGGELYFTALDIAIKPKRGMFVGMTGGFHHEHGVLRVTSGTRLTMPFFLTFDPKYADRRLIEWPTPPG